MSEAPKIYAAISAAMADINPVGKDKYNVQQKFKYRGIDDVMNTLYPVLCRHGLFIVPEVLEHSREERLYRSTLPGIRLRYEQSTKVSQYILSVSYWGTHLFFQQRKPMQGSSKKK